MPTTYRFCSLTLSLMLISPCRACFHLFIIPINFLPCLFPSSHANISCACTPDHRETVLGRDFLDRSTKPANRSPLTLCLPKEHSSRPWQPASLFTYPVCRHMIAMATCWLPCQFSNAIVLCILLTCCFSLGSPSCLSQCTKFF